MRLIQLGLASLLLCAAAMLAGCGEDCGPCDDGTCGDDGRCYRDTCSFPHSHLGDSGGACSSPGESCVYDTWEWTFSCTCVAPEGIFVCGGNRFNTPTCLEYGAYGAVCRGAPPEGCPPDAKHPTTTCFCEDYHWRCQ